MAEEMTEGVLRAIARRVDSWAARPRKGSNVRDTAAVDRRRLMAEVIRLRRIVAADKGNRGTDAWLQMMRNEDAAEPDEVIGLRAQRRALLRHVDWCEGVLADMQGEDGAKLLREQGMAEAFNMVLRMLRRQRRVRTGAPGAILDIARREIINTSINAVLKMSGAWPQGHPELLPPAEARLAREAAERDYDILWAAMSSLIVLAAHRPHNEVIKEVCAIISRAMGELGMGNILEDAEVPA